MALDGVYLSLIRRELEEKLLEARVDKIHQPSKGTIIIGLRTRNHGNLKLLMCAAAGTARVHITEREFENPKVPPMFCMLLRKHLSSGKLIAIRQEGCERILNFDFEATDELGDRVVLTLAAEIMGRCSNVILIGKEGRVIDSIKRVNDDMSSVRRILPGIAYTLPPKEARLNLFSLDREELFGRLSLNPSADLAKTLLRTLEGVSPIFTREAVDYACHGERAVKELDGNERDRLWFYLQNTAKLIESGENRYVLLKDKQGKMTDFCFTQISQYGSLMTTREYSSPCELLDVFYYERDLQAQNHQRADDLFKTVVALSERIRRRVSSQRQELLECTDRELYKIKGDLIMSNLYRIQKGDKIAVVENFYDEACPQIEIKLDTRLTPSQNAQKYYNDYRKLDTKEKMLTRLIAEGEEEARYIDSVFDALSRAATESELSEIRNELWQSGYMKQPKSKQKQPKALPPIEYISSDGYPILVGRNNVQNDKLTLKMADKSDIWLHTKDLTGSHVIIKCGNVEPPMETVEEAALIAAYNSSARTSSLVPVDYVPVRYVKKPAGAKPGMVIFTNNKTLYVTPDEETVNALRKDK